VFSSGERYATIILNFVLIAAVSRILTPAEIGVSVIGATIVAFTEGIRDSTSTHLVHKKELTREDSRTCFTIMLVITMAIAGVLSAVAGWLGEVLRQDKLEPFIYVVSLSLLPGCFERPIMALLRREMQFATYACVTVLAAVITLVVTVGLALAGFSYMCFAWGMLAGTSSAAVLALCFRPYFWIYRLDLAEWREVLALNGYGTVTASLGAAYDTLPYAILGRQAQFAAVGFYNRTVTVCRLPDKLNAGIITLALPAFSQIARDGGDLAGAYFRGIELVTVFEWPLRVMIAIFAYPAVLVLLGSQWTSIVPLVQIMSLALVFATPQILSPPLLVAAGGVHDTLAVNLITWPLAIAVISVGAWLGLYAMAFAMFLIAPWQTFVSVLYIRKHVPFAWGAFAAAFRKSAVVTLCSAAGPLLIVAASGFRFDLSIAPLLVAGVMSVAGWFMGAWLTRHPVWFEVELVASGLRRWAGLDPAAKLSEQ
jgi:O-antigen/teichoic acid export membrane protein